jgi:hypothetical protein
LLHSQRNPASLQYPRCRIEYATIRTLRALLALRPHITWKNPLAQPERAERTDHPMEVPPDFRRGEVNKEGALISFGALSSPDSAPYPT